MPEDRLQQNEIDLETAQHLVGMIDVTCDLIQTQACLLAEQMVHEHEDLMAAAEVVEEDGEIFYIWDQNYFYTKTSQIIRSASETTDICWDPGIDEVTGVRYLSDALGDITDPTVRGMRAFLRHDFMHVSPSHPFEILNAFAVFAKNPPTEDYPNGYIRINQRHKDLIDDISLNRYGTFELMAFPLNFLKEHLALHTGIDLPESEPEDLEQMLLAIAKSLQCRFIREDYVILVNPGDAELATPQSKIILNIPQGISIASNANHIRQIAYNLAKNGMKAVAQKETGFDLRRYYRERMTPDPVECIRIDVETNEDLLTLSFQDSGGGFSIDTLIDDIRRKLGSIGKTGLTDEEILALPFGKAIANAFGSEAAKILQWRFDPMVFRTWTMGEVLNYRLQARMTGDTTRSVTSGTGLYAVANATQKLGGTILPSNSFDSGAYVPIAIPKSSLGMAA